MVGHSGLMRRFWFACGLAVWLSAAYSGEQPASGFEFKDFSTDTGLKFAGAAARTGKILYLTPATKQSVGAAWFATRQPVARGFDATFQFRLSSPGGTGADGFAFVIQNTGPAAVAGRGSEGGFAIPRSLAVFFNTYRNKDAADPAHNNIAICTNLGQPGARWPSARIAYTPDLHSVFKDIHTARIAYAFPILSVYLDDAAEPALRSPVDLSIAADPSGEA